MNHFNTSGFSVPVSNCKAKNWWIKWRIAFLPWTLGYHSILFWSQWVYQGPLGFQARKTGYWELHSSVVRLNPFQVMSMDSIAGRPLGIPQYSPQAAWWKAGDYSSTIFIGLCNGWDVLLFINNLKQKYPLCISMKLNCIFITTVSSMTVFMTFITGMYVFTSRCSTS